MKIHSCALSAVLATIALLCAFTPAARAAASATVPGFLVKQEIVRRSPPGPEGEVRESVQPMTLRLAGARARLEDAAGEALVVRLDRGEMYELDDLLMSFEKKTFQGLRQQWRTVNAMILEQIEAVPPHHPHRAELVDELTAGDEKWRQIRLLPDGAARDRLLAKYGLPERAPEIELRRTEEKEEVLGHEALLYEVLEDGVPTDMAYIAPGLRFDVRYYEFLELMGWIAPDLAAGLRRVKGMPLHTLMHVRGGGVIEVRIVAIEKASLDPSIFEVPGDYRERKPRRTFD